MSSSTDEAAKDTTPLLAAVPVSAAPSSAAVSVECCVICMEELPADQVRQHNSCKCVMCNPCVERTIEHHEAIDREIPKGMIKCPGCRETADPMTEFVPPDQIGKSKPKRRLLSLPTLMRAELEGGVSAPVPLGHPAQVKVYNQVVGRELHSLLVPADVREALIAPYELVVCDSQGKGCGRCLFSSEPCRGCLKIKDDEAEVLLQSNDTIAVSFMYVVYP